MAAQSAFIGSFVLLLLLVLVLSSSTALKLNLHGTVYPDGEIYATMKIGARVEYNLHVDTGSVLTWLQCRVPRRSHCKAPCQTWRQSVDLYNLIPNTVMHKDDPVCKEFLGQQPMDLGKIGCRYKLHYVEEKTQGYLFKDELTIRSNVLQSIVFGCGYHQEGQHVGLPIESKVHGVLGLGRGGSMVLTAQLKQQGVTTKNVITHCFRARGDGFLFIGEHVQASVGISMVHLDPYRGKDDNYYSSTVQAALLFDGQKISDDRLMKVAFDSGATYTYFDNEAYFKTVNVLVKHAQGASLREVRDPAMALCWKGPHPFQSVYEAKSYFKTLSLVFTTQQGKKSTLEIPPENYLIISKQNNACLAVHQANLDPETHGINLLIGVVTMQDRIMIYDNEEGSIGWAHDSCESRTEPESVITSRL